MFPHLVLACAASNRRSVAHASAAFIDLGGVERAQATGPLLRLELAADRASKRGCERHTHYSTRAGCAQPSDFYAQFRLN